MTRVGKRVKMSSSSFQIGILVYLVIVLGTNVTMRYPHTLLST